MSENPQPNRSKVTVQEAPLLVSPAQSSKLAALRDRARGVEVASVIAPTNPINTALSDDVAAELRKARRLIDERCASILANYPKAKQNKLFSFRFGPIDELKKLPVTEIFKRLDLDKQLLNQRLLGKLNYHGHTPE